MAELENGCFTNSAAIHKAAMNRLDDLTGTPWYTNSNESEEAARVKHHIKILEATNELDAAELLDIAHSCSACNPDACPDGTERCCAVHLAEALIDDAEDKLKRMEPIATRIRNRNCQIQKLEQHLKIFGTILESMNIVIPGVGTEYSYTIDPLNGISLVIQGPKNSDAQDQKGPSPTDLLDSNPPRSVKTPVLQTTGPSRPTLLDSDTPQSVMTPVLETTCTPQPAPAPAPAPSPAPVANHAQTNTENKAIKKKDTGKKTAGPAEPTLKIPDLQVWESNSEWEAVYNQHLANLRGQIDPDVDTCPMYFQRGLSLNYHPEGGPTARCCMVIFSGLHPRTTYTELLDKVRGGLVMRISRANSTTMAVSFVRDIEARNYVRYVNDPWREEPLVTIRGVAPRIALACTPSYPRQPPLMDGIYERGVTRCLEIPHPGQFSCWSLDSFFGARKLWAFTEAPGIEYVVVKTVPDDDDDDDDDNDDDNNENENGDDNDEMVEDLIPEEWVVVDHNDTYKQEPKQTPRPAPTTTTTRVLRVAFRDVEYAQKAHGLIQRNFPGCGVRYARDRCAGPLRELDE
ncbi:hypothetical protein F4859DRAFT_522840 [Xylaria cf. heliscus]|nr:hypothetical protein F4859DRAFT_522840 [Xylaria cf. heliscus]